ncbi:helix-turn-helix transcriptional regulator [Actinomadura sp. HBU206391]|uniref:helix-turn-helix transcriptional regulator n=1 Tax=Actinomadura sp. HBU206391 TaxID=2731692 RepID=UPI00164FE29F|nr:helix-turn-helix transcriptional regulator [Actinomadura sp. HBU206391]MBC6463667.1 helix-turn-helix transcriptional regulator [Actinomadura sp. HBU206391]
MGDDVGSVRTALLTLHRVTGLPVVFGGALAGRQRFRITELMGNTTDALNGLVIRQGSGLGGKAMAVARPVWVSDYPKSGAISHDYDRPVTVEGLLSVVAVPVVVRRRVRAVLYGALREPLALADRVIASAVEAARDLEQDLAVRDEAYDRLARLQQSGPAPEHRAESARWEEVRALHAELRGIAGQIADAELKARLLSASDRLAGAAEPAGPAAGPPTPRPVLSARELDVLSYVAIGCTNAETAQQLGVLPETVKSYLRSAMRKLGGRTRLEAVAAGRRAGLLP